MKLTLLTLVRDEGSRWLPSLLSQWQEYADAIIALDDGSTDDTVALLRGAGASVHARGDVGAAWGAEAPARRQLFNIGCASDASWLLWLDADMGFTRNPRSLIEAADVAGTDAVAFRLYDLWQADRRHLLYREDAYWRAHHVPRVWCIRKPANADAAEWPARGLHCGHLPSAGLSIKRVVTAPRDISLLHYAYSREDERMHKYAAYTTKADILTPAELAHAETIIDPKPQLLLLPTTPQWVVEYGRPYA